MIREINIINRDFREVLERNNVRGFALSLEFKTLSKVLKTNAEFSVSDINTNILAIQLLNNGSPIVIEESSIIYANIERADGTVVTNKCEVVDGSIGAILVKFSKLSNEIVGTNKLEIVVCHTNNEKIVSPKLSYKTFQTIESYYESPEQDHVDVLDILVDEVTTLKNNIINTNSTLEQEIAERKVIYNQFDEAEKERVSNEIERQASHESIKLTEESVKENEELRKENMEQMINDFNGCMDNFNSKVNEVDEKIEELNSNEELREQDHKERIEFFDEIIKSDHQEIMDAEKERVVEEEKRNESELKREQFFTEVQGKIDTWSAEEEIRISQEESRVELFEEMISTFDSKAEISDEKVSKISEKITEATQKITQFSKDEDNRNIQHSARVKKFDDEIIPKHQQMIEGESNRVSQELSRVTAERERVSFYNQTKLDESARVTADKNREEKVRTLEARIDSKVDETDTHIRTLEARVNTKIDETDVHVTTLENRINSKINEYNTATLITNSEIDTIIANALK